MNNKTNTGNYNSGNYNSGYYNSGNYNSGNRNSGDWNSGNYNSGNYNSGYYNSGDWNSGDWNSGDCNSGLFNTDEPKMRIFNKESDITYSEWLNSNSYIYFDIPLNEFICENDMTDKEKEEHPEWKTTGGYLKTLEYKEAWAKWWEENKSEDMIKRIKNLPNFDSRIFKKITGISIDEEDDMIEIDGKKISKSTIKEALKALIN